MMVACGEYESFSYDEPSKEPETPTTDKRDEAFIKAAGGPIDPNQTWISASTLDLNIATQGNCQINVYTSGSELRECFRKCLTMAQSVSLCLRGIAETFSWSVLMPKANISMKP